MKYDLITKIGLAGIAATLLSLGAGAADLASAAGNLAEISAISAQAKGNLAVAALGGDVEQIAEMSKRADAVDAAVSEGQMAFAQMERAAAGGDEDAASSAGDDLSAALQKAKDALNGVIPVDKASQHQQWKESKTNTGGGPGKPGDAVNVYIKPWNTATVQNMQQNQWGTFFASGVTSGEQVGDRDATPE